MRPFLEQLQPGKDAFPLEGQATELEARLGELSEGLRGGRARVAAVLTSLLAQEFRGAPLLPADEPASNESPLQVQRAAALPTDATLDARAFGGEVQRLTRDLRDVTVAEFLITSLVADGTDVPPSRLRTTVRYDLVGSGTTMHRVEHVGEWELTWQRTASRWQIVRWTALSHVVSRAKRPVFTEITDAALGGNESFQRQLGIDLDTWMATIDSVLTRDSNGHHGVSVGDADGDGLDDLYVTQPAGLPNRLYRNRGDSTFDDITDRAGLGVLDDTASSLFADVDNDGDEDLVLATATTPLLFINDGKGHFTPRGGRLPVRPAAAGRADVDVRGGLRPRRLRRPVSVRLFLFLRGRRGQGRHAGAVLRRAERTARDPASQRRPRPFRGRDERGRTRRRKRSLSLRRRLGRLRRRRLARSPGRERLRDEEPVPQPRMRGTAA